MMRINLSETIDGVNYHAEVEGVDEARDFLTFLGTLRRAGTPMAAEARVVEAQSMTIAGNIPAAPQAPAQVKAEAQGQKWTRENLQPIVVNLAKERDKFVALLQKFGVSRFRELPDDKLNDFGIACEGVAA